MSIEDKIYKKICKPNLKQRVYLNKPYTITLKNLFYVKKDEKYDYIVHRLNFLKPYFESILNTQFKPVNYLSSTTFQTFGIITNISDTKIDRNSIYICNIIDESNSVPVKLNLNYLKWFSVFPGQVLAVSGKNVLGNEIVVEEIHSIPEIEENYITENEINKYKSIYEEKPLEIIVVSGPFENESIECVFQKDADVLVLIGPLIEKESEETPQEIFNTIWISKIEAWLRRSMTSKVILVPSINDIFTSGIYPQEAYDFILPSERIILLSNPSSIYINEFLFSFSSFDNLYQLAIEECYFKNQNLKAVETDRCSEMIFKEDRITRLSYYLVYQRSYLPVFPVKEAINYNSPYNFDMNIAPNFYITSSKLKEGSRLINPTTVVNIGIQSKLIAKSMLRLVIGGAIAVFDNGENKYSEPCERTKIEFLKYSTSKN